MVNNISNYVYENIVTNADYLESTGIDLNAELVSMIVNDVGDEPADRFIYGIEEWCKSYLQERYTFNGELESGNQTKRFKKGVIYQIQYVLRNGNISNDSGFIASNGTVVSRELLDKIGMGSNALREFRLGGMANIARY